MSNDPSEMLVGILSRLPVKSLLRFRSISQPVCALIDSPYFVNLHMKQSMKTDKLVAVFSGYRSSTSLFSLHMDPHPIGVELKAPFKSTLSANFLGSCRGLICLYSGIINRSLILWNPSTRKCKVLPTPLHVSPPGYGHVVPIDQVGYDYVNDDYKVVRLAQCCGPLDVKVKVIVYSLKLDVWKLVEQDFPSNYFPVSCSGQVVCANGAVHWLVNQRTGPNLDYVICAFDLATQTFNMVPQPEYSDRYMSLDLGVLGGCLCVVGNREMYSVDVWVMREHGVKDSWSKLVALTMTKEMTRVYPYVRPIIYLKDGKEVLLEVNRKGFLVYDLEVKQPKHMWLCGEFHIATFVYQETLL